MYHSSLVSHCPTNHHKSSRNCIWKCVAARLLILGTRISTQDTKSLAYPTYLVLRSLSCQEGRKKPHMEPQNDLYEDPVNIHRFAIQNVKIATRITSFCKALHVVRGVSNRTTDGRCLYGHTWRRDRVMSRPRRVVPTYRITIGFTEE